MVTKATTKRVRAHYKAQGYEVRIDHEGHVNIRKNGPWREGRWVSEYRVIDGAIVLT
jgi:hypothetical protein